jgi:hypothetical protein
MMEQWHELYLKIIILWVLIEALRLGLKKRARKNVFSNELKDVTDVYLLLLMRNLFFR